MIMSNGNLRVDLRLIADMVETGSRVLDVGCGDGTLLAWLGRHKNVDGRGIELSMAGVSAAVAQGLSVIQGDADTDLKDYPSGAFDTVILSQTLQADVSVYSLGEMSFAFGAIGAGIFVMAVVRKWGDLQAMVGNILLFAVMIIVMVSLPYGWALIAAYLFFGWCNASTRLIRQSLYMKVVPRQMMGRVMSFFNSFGMMMRLVLIGFFTILIDYTGAGVGYLILAVLLLLAAFGVVATMRFLLADMDQGGEVATKER